MPSPESVADAAGMVLPRTRSRLLLLAGFLSVAAALAWLMFVFAADRTGMTMLPDAGGSTIEVLDDATGRLQLADAIASPATAWKTWAGGGDLLAPRHHALWLRIVLRNPGDVSWHGVLADLQYYPDRLTAWQRDAAGRWRRQDSGEARPTREKPIWGRTAAFPVDVPAKGETTLYLRGQDYYFVYVQIRWWPRMQDFLAAQLREGVAESACYGALAALLLYNLVLWIRLRFPDTGCYVCYAAGMAAFNFVTNGGGALLGFAVTSPVMESVLTGLLAGSGFFALQFARTFLGTAVLAPRSDRGLRLLRTLLAVVAAGSLAMPWFGLLHWLAAATAAVTVTHATLLAVAVQVWRAGDRQARFFVAAFGVLFLGGLPAAVAWFEHTLTANTAMGLLASSTLEMLLLSFAIADRFAGIQRERLRAQQQLVEESERRRAMQEAYADELELEVRERTRELEAANVDKDRMIAVLGHDLRGPLTGLTQSAARLGERSAPAELVRFAREAAQTGRLLLLLIEDLVMWARLQAGSLQITAHTVAEWISPALALHHGLRSRAGLEITEAVPAGLAIESDLVLAQALVRNLVSNAVRYARRRVRISAWREADRVRLAVCDDGPGLPADVAAWLASGGPGSPAGSGLGLRFCVEIARALGATIEPGITPGGGTTLVVSVAAPAEIS